MKVLLTLRLSNRSHFRRIFLEIEFIMKKKNYYQSFELTVHYVHTRKLSSCKILGFFSLKKSERAPNILSCHCVIFHGSPAISSILSLFLTRIIPIENTRHSEKIPFPSSVNIYTTQLKRKRDKRGGYTTRFV